MRLTDVVEGIKDRVVELKLGVIVVVTTQSQAA